MGTRIRHTVMRILPILAVYIASIVLHGCIYDNEGLHDDDTGISAGMVQMGFRIRLSDEYGSHTAGTQSDETFLSSDSDNPTKYETGTGYENYLGINENDFHVLLFDGEGRFVETMTIFKAIPTSSGEHPSEYTVLCLLNRKPAGAFKIAVLANWGISNYSGFSGIKLEGKNINDILTADWACFEAFNNFQLSVAERRLIPFYGFASFENITWIAGKIHDLGDIGLLRAMAKAEVNLEGLPDGVTLEGAPLIRGINPSGFCAPLGPIGSGNNWNTDYITGIHLPSGEFNHQNAMENTAVMLAVDRNRWIAYLPEFRNIGTGENFSRIELKFSHLDEPFVLNFARYDSNGHPDNTNGRYDIRRNDLYRFNVRADLHEILFSLAVEKWELGGQTEIEM